jgi:hypothetical protein
MDVSANVVLSDEESTYHEPDAKHIDDYVQVYNRVCAAAHLAEANATEFLESLNDSIVKLGGSSQQCS